LFIFQFPAINLRRIIRIPPQRSLYPPSANILAIVGLIVLFFMNAIRIVREYERGVIFRLGRLVGAKGPGLFLIIPIVDKMVKITLRLVTPRGRSFRCSG
jgi:regulator of protease activity HflC (stomatin/prohibitin superfamily)